MILVAMIAFIYGVKDGYRSKQLRFIPYYTLSSLLETSVGFYYFYLNKDIGKRRLLSHIDLLLSLLFLLLELFLLTNFLLKSIASKRKRRLTRIAACLYIISTILIITYWIRYAPKSIEPPIYAIESIYLLIPCLFYFYELFEFPHPDNFRSRPSFWVAAGILLYHSCSIPLFVLMPVMTRKFPAYVETVYSINYILYSLFFSMLIRACKLVPKVASG